MDEELRRLVAAALLAAPWGAVWAHAPATAPLIRPLHLEEAQRIATNVPGGSFTSAIVGVDKGITVAPSSGWGDIIAYDSAGARRSWSLSIGGSKGVDVRYVAGVGAVGMSIWLNDPGYGQIVFVDAQGRVAKSVEYPSWIHPTWAERHRYPVFGTFQPLAVYADSSMLVIPRRPHSFLGTSDYDKSSTYLLRATFGGTILHTIARIPVQAGDVGRSVSPRGPFRFPRPMYEASMDGRRIAVLLPASPPGDTAHFRVVMLTDQGDTVFARSYEYASLLAAARSGDSLLHAPPTVAGSAVKGSPSPATSDSPSDLCRLGTVPVFALGNTSTL